MKRERVSNAGEEVTSAQITKRASDILHDLSGETGIKKRELLSRMLAWFNRLEPLQRAIVMRQVSEGDAADIATLIVDRRARQAADAAADKAAQDMGSSTPSEERRSGGQRPR